MSPPTFTRSTRGGILRLYPAGGGEIRAVTVRGKGGRFACCRCEAITAVGPDAEVLDSFIAAHGGPTCSSADGATRNR